MHLETGAMLLTCAADENVAESAKIMFRKLAECMGFENKGIICATNVWAAGEISNRTVLRDAYNLGKLL